MNDDEIFTLYKDVFEQDSNEISESNIVCDHNYQPIDGMYVCILCGETTGKFVILEHQIGFYKGFQHVYKRKSYFREKLKLLNGAKQSTSKDYIEMLDNIKQIP